MSSARETDMSGGPVILKQGVWECEAFYAVVESGGIKEQKSDPKKP